MTSNEAYLRRHCHIAWHAAGGLGVTFLERAADLRDGASKPDVDALNAQCTDWNNWYPQAPYKQYDSGI